MYYAETPEKKTEPPRTEPQKGKSFIELISHEGDHNVRDVNIEIYFELLNSIYYAEQPEKRLEKMTVETKKGK